ncbi:MAG: hypothetical protein HYX78_06035 [Armatimonadetes bacterium]|nr:hypothetical protein [Armatimonadota bacterium]
MNWRLRILICAALSFCGSMAAVVASSSVQVGDAYARGSADGLRWTIGTGAVQLAFESKDGQLRLAGYQNKLCSPAREYLTGQADPFLLESRGGYTIESVWTKSLKSNGSADPVSDKVQIAVKRGDKIAFCVGAVGGQHKGAETKWITTVDYGDGESYASSDETTLAQGPVWHYCIHKRGTRYLEPLDSIEQQPGGDKVRVMIGRTWYTAPTDVPLVGSTKLHPSIRADSARVWQATKDGVVTIRGQAENVGGGETCLEILVFRPNPLATGQPVQSGKGWSLESGGAREIAAGGRPAVQLDLALRRQALRVDLHIVAYPGTSVLRQWVEIENAGSSEVAIESADHFSIAMPEDKSSSFTHYWMYGANSRPNQGLLQSDTVSDSYHHAAFGYETDYYYPWMAIQGNGPDGDGWFMAAEYLGDWVFSTDHQGSGPVIVTASLPELIGYKLTPGARLQLPLLTFGVFRDDLDDMGRRLYDWQYEYLWDYTNDYFYGRTQLAHPWVAEATNLQDMFASRMAKVDMDWTDILRTCGFDALWDDAGWSEGPTWAPSREGPDFSQVLRYLTKMDATWILWFCGWPSQGIMDTKVGSWGDFQWRTDAIGGFNFDADKRFRSQIEHFLTQNPRSSFHTCNGGSRYAHTFEIQRYADLNYLSDSGRGDQTNFYFSYLDPPDKWMEMIEVYYANGKYRPDTARQNLTVVPCWDYWVTHSDRELVRQDVDLYRYMLREGVAGRWSYVSHPVVKGDKEFYYFQRLNHDRTKSMIIPTHRAESEVTIYPRGLLPEHKYIVGFDSTKETTVRTGANLMTNGITFKKQAPRELVYLNLSNRPLGGRDKIAPDAPGRVVTRRETNVGHGGVGIYWSPGSDDNWISYYEVRRDSKILGKASKGLYFFDHSEGWDPEAQYAVRTVDGDGNISPWTLSEPILDEPLVFAVFGGNFPERGYDGWYADTTTDDKTFTPMVWATPAKTPYGDYGGIANQPQGSEGCWESANGARVGRGWQQASTDAQCVRSWVAPKAGKVRIISRVMKEYYRRDKGGPLRVRILHGEKQIWPLGGWAQIPVEDLKGCMHDLTVDVAKGDVVRFVLDKGTTPKHDIIAWMPRIVYLQNETAGEASVVRILCGAKKPYTDRAGNVWSADRFFSGGKPVASKVGVTGALPTLEDQALYQYGREGKDFSYSIPVKPGLYTLRLKFAETKFQWSFERPFNLSINGKRALTNFDICQAARGSKKAYERVFRYLVPDADGGIMLRFTGGIEPSQKTDRAMVQAIEVLPEVRPAMRIDAGSDSQFVDWNSVPWSADTGFEDREVLCSDSAVSQASPTLYDQALYQTARSGKSLSYTIHVPAGLYAVHLKFAELWLKEPGQRPMNIEINGRRIRESWDPAKAAGQVGMAADIRAQNITPDKDGNIKIRITATGNNDAIVQGIEIE